MGDKVRVRLSPTRGVFALGAAPEGGLVFAPESLQVKALPPGSTPPSGAVEVLFKPPVAEETFWICPYSGSDCCVPFWHVASTELSSAANVILGQYWVSMIIGADYAVGPALVVPGPPPTRRKTSKQPVDDASTVVVRIPVMVNASAVRPDDELRIYRPAAPKRERLPGVITMAAVAKKPKA
jgi:hypothetical protein